MPLYQYRHENEKTKCKSGIRFEKNQPMSEEADSKCDVCGKPVERLISPPGAIIFKGGENAGWTKKFFDKK